MNPDASNLQVADRALQLQRLRQFQRLMFPVALFFGTLYLAGGALFHIPILEANAVNVLGCAAAVFYSLRLTARGELERAAQVVAHALFGMTAVGAFLVPFLLPMLVLIPVAGVTLVLPYLPQSRLRRLLLVGFLVEMGTVVLATLRAGIAPVPPSVLQHFIVVTASGCAVGLLFLLLWQDAMRLRHSLNVAAQREAERERLLQVTEEARAQAEAANQVKDDFLATVSHELRTPLTAMLGWLHMLRTAGPTSPTAPKALEIVERNARSQAQLIEDLLDVSRIISGKLRLEVAPVELVPVVNGALDSIRPSALARGVELLADVGTPVTVMADPARLQQIIWNLLSNAVKFTAKGGWVKLQLTQLNSSVQLSVQDNGQGIAPEFLPHVFDRFRQADSSTTRASGGLGLGLSIARHLVELHGGSLKAQSDGVGQGATFTLQLSVAVSRTRELPPLPTAASGVAERLKGKRILVVDDEVDAREFLRALLERYQMAVTTASSVEDALAEVQRQRPELIVSDIGMPRENGYSFIQRLRALSAEQGGRVPALALTAYTRVEDRREALVAGFDMHLPKPVDPNELVSVLEDLAQVTRPA